MGIAERSARRKRKIVAHVAKDFADAERWDLEFWQSQSPEARLSALVAIRRDVAKVREARKADRSSPKGEDDWRP